MHPGATGPVTTGSDTVPGSNNFEDSSDSGEESEAEVVRGVSPSRDK